MSTGSSELRDRKNVGSINLLTSVREREGEVIIHLRVTVQAG